MFTAAHTTIAKIWKQPNFPRKDVLINKLWDIHTTEYYSTIRLNHMVCCYSEKSGEYHMSVVKRRGITVSEWFFTCGRKGNRVREQQMFKCNRRGEIDYRIELNWPWQGDRAMAGGEKQAWHIGGGYGVGTLCNWNRTMNSSTVNHNATSNKIFLK